ncbi:MAG: hypothetical protein JWQ87_3923 [Candidatus Sulfotelmatobacter sp.]|nr:hypothetical protein [Candidatus Sulfotelmatobacter sp.]
MRLETTEQNAQGISSQGIDLTPPSEVEFHGSRSVGPFLVLRYIGIRIREEERKDERRIIEWRSYADRYLNSEGKEVCREIGEVADSYRDISNDKPSHRLSLLDRLRVLFS